MAIIASANILIGYNVIYVVLFFWTERLIPYYVDFNYAFFWNSYELKISVCSLSRILHTLIIYFKIKWIVKLVSL